MGRAAGGAAWLADENSKRLRLVLGRLERAYDRPVWRRGGSAVDCLVGTILSQNTSSANSSAGFRRLKETFRTWEEAADAPVALIERCIRPSGLSRIKAPRIRRILRLIREDRGRIDLEFLGRLPAAEAAGYLLRFDGVGPKTALCTLLFAFNMPVFPVDTHIHRIALRLGVLPGGTSAEKAHELLLPLIPPRSRYAMHVLLIRHGRRVCRAGRPLCRQCVLLQYCDHGRSMLGGGQRRSAAEKRVTP